MTVTILQGDCRDILPTLPDASVQMCVTSPPYWNLRDYGVDGQIGLESTVDIYVNEMVEVFREVRRVLTDDGTCWINLGDSYVSAPTGHAGSKVALQGGKLTQMANNRHPGKHCENLPAKNMVGIPWRVALALQADGWILRQDIIWHKPNPMPESVRDRCTKSHEYLFLLSKSPRYYFDQAAIAESSTWELSTSKRPDGWDTSTGEGAHGTIHRAGREQGVPAIYRGSRFDRGKTIEHQLGRVSHKERRETGTRNKRSVWTIATQKFADAHFATFPEKLIEPCILAGSREGDRVIDPFAGSGTTGEVAQRLNRNATLIELNPAYIPMIERRTAQQGLDMVGVSDAR